MKIDWRSIEDGQAGATAPTYLASGQPSASAGDAGALSPHRTYMPRLATITVLGTYNVQSHVPIASLYVVGNIQFFATCDVNY